jgi:hypothetical protein
MALGLGCLRRWVMRCPVRAEVSVGKASTPWVAQWSISGDTAESFIGKPYFGCIECQVYICRETDVRVAVISRTTGCVPNIE